MLFSNTDFFFFEAWLPSFPLALLPAAVFCKPCQATSCRGQKPAAYFFWVYETCEHIVFLGSAVECRLNTGSISEEGVRVKILFNITVTALTLQLEQNLTNDIENLWCLLYWIHFPSIVIVLYEIPYTFLLLKKLKKKKNSTKSYWVQGMRLPFHCLMFSLRNMPF